MSIKKTGIIVLLLIAIFLGGYLLLSQEKQNYAGPIERMTIGTNPTEAATLIFVAYDLGYFAENGLDVELKEYPVSSLALPDFFSGDLDILFSGEYTAVIESFERNDFRILSSIDSGKSIYVVARKDHGIEKPEDLKNKKIGVLAKSAPEFLLIDFLLSYRLRSSDVEIVNLHTPSETTMLLIDDAIDAVVTWNPYLNEIQGQLGEKIAIWDIQEDQDYFVLLFSRKEFVESSPEAIEKLLKALQQAEDFVRENPSKAQAILANRLGYEEYYLASIWGKHNFNIALTQSLILLMEDEARWAIKNKLTNATEVPNYLNYIYMDALEQVKPGAVTIIR